MGGGGGGELDMWGVEHGGGGVCVGRGAGYGC